MKPLVGAAIAALAFPTHAEPLWEAMVISLDRRADRLRHFEANIRAAEPWLLLGERMCRIPGRDGRELQSKLAVGASSGMTGGQNDSLGISQADRRFKTRVGGSLQVAASDGSNESVQSTKAQEQSEVPLHMDDIDNLLNGGWVASTALASAAAADAEWPNMTAGGVGLYIAHAAAWRRVVSKKLAYGLIFEDDLTLFAPNFGTQVRALLEGRESEAFAFPTHWDFLYLQRCNDESWLKQRPGDNLPESTRNIGMSNRATNMLSAAHSAQVPIPAGASVTCTGAYIVTQRGAQQLLAEALPAKQQLDWQLSTLSGLYRAALSPPVAQCEEVVATNNGKEVRDTDVQRPRAPEPQRRLRTVAPTKYTPAEEIGGFSNDVLRDCES